MQKFAQVIWAGLALAACWIESASAQCSTPNTLGAPLSNPSGVNDCYVIAVSISGELIVTGAPFGGAYSSGIAHVLNAPTGDYVMELNNPSPEPVSQGYPDLFGYSVAASGDLAVVGAPGQEGISGVGGGSLNDAGKAYVFDVRTGELVTTLKHPRPVLESLNFGWDVAISGDRVIVGIPNHYMSNFFGEARVFDASDGTSISIISNPVPERQPYDQFGSAVAMSGDLAIVGAPYKNVNQSDAAGKAYIFDATSGNLLHSLSAAEPLLLGEFGYSVAISGNLVVVGAPGCNPVGVAGAGAAYVFNASTGSLVSILGNPTPQAGDCFGASVSISGGLAIVGAYGDDSVGLHDSGRAYVFNAASGALLSTLSSPAPRPDNKFGGAVGISGGIAIAGRKRSLSWNDSDGCPGPGEVYAFACGNLSSRIRSHLLGMEIGELNLGELDTNGDGAVDIADLLLSAASEAGLR